MNMISNAYLSAAVKSGSSAGVEMRWIRKLFAGVLLTWLFAVTCTAESDMKEYCQMQTFEATCKEDEVILMKTARYGRMRLGRCLTRNYYVGCSADVSVHMHARCSGRRHCRVPIPDPTMFAAQPCPKDLVAYMEADYECVKVAKWNPEDCLGGGPQVLTAPSGYISRPPTKSAEQKHACPRRIEALPGQRVNIYLNDFYSKHGHVDSSNDHHDVATNNNNAATANSDSCITYGYVAEEAGMIPKRICGGEFKKNQLIYSSETNMVDITLTEPSAHSHHYLLKYEVVGCPMLDLPENAWVQMQEDTAIVTCNNSKTAFHLVCVGNEWVGEIQNCTEADVDMPVADLMSGGSRLPFGNIFVNTGLFLAISIGVALGVLLGIGLLTLAHTFYSTRRSRAAKRNQPVDSGSISLLKKPAPFMNQPCADHLQSGGQHMEYHLAEPHQHVHVPITLDGGCNGSEYGTKSFIPLVPVRQLGEHLYESPRPGDLSTFRAARLTMSTFGDYDVGLENGLPAVENTYGPIETVRITQVDGRTTTTLPPPPDCCHANLINEKASLTPLGVGGGCDHIITINPDNIPS